MPGHEPVSFIVNRIADKGGKVRKQGKEFKCQCPAHEDGKASLQVGYGEKGAVLHCHAGCTTEAIMGKLELPMESMFTDYGERTDRDPRLEQHHNLRGAAPRAEATYIYDDENGNVLFRVERQPGKKFIQARPDPHQPGNWLYTLGDTRRVLYHLQNVLGAAKAAEKVWLVEGEKDVHTLEEQGLIATCNPMGAGKFKREHAEYLAGANVVILPDNDTPGKDHARVVTEYLRDTARSVKTIELPGLPEHGDVTDWFAAATVLHALSAAAQMLHGQEVHTAVATLLAMEKEVEPDYTNRPVIFDAAGLMKEEFPDVVMAVPGIVAEGATFLVGAPKIGKSWMSLGLGLAVAGGEMALGTISVEQGPVLYLALEDTPRRLQRRMQVMLGAQDAPEDLHFACNWPRLGAGGLDQLEDWLKDNDNARMVIIDTWAKVKSSVGERDSMYQADYSAVSAVKSLADNYGCAIVMVHHQRKAADNDPLNTVAGSTGLTGAADATVVLTRPRGAEEGKLYVTGRDVEESMSIVSFDAQTGHWTWLGEADEVEEQNTEKRVIKLLAGAGLPIGPKDVAEELEIKEGTAKWLLAKLAQEGKITRVSRGKYTAEENGGGGGKGGGVAIAPVTVQPPMPGTGGVPMAQGPAVIDDDDDDVDLSEFEDEFGGVDDDEVEDEG
jgi:hypothetical protein